MDDRFLDPRVGGGGGFGRLFVFLFYVSEAEAEAAGQNSSAPAGSAPGGDGEHSVGGFPDGAPGGVGGFRATEVAEGVHKLRRIDLLLGFRPPPGATGLCGKSSGGVGLNFSPLAREIGIGVGIR